MFYQPRSWETQKLWSPLTLSSSMPCTQMSVDQCLAQAPKQLDYKISRPMRWPCQSRGSQLWAWIFWGRGIPSCTSKKFIVHQIRIAPIEVALFWWPRARCWCPNQQIAPCCFGGSHAWSGPKGYFWGWPWWMKRVHTKKTWVWGAYLPDFQNPGCFFKNPMHDIFLTIVNNSCSPKQRVHTEGFLR